MGIISGGDRTGAQDTRGAERIMLKHGDEPT